MISNIRNMAMDFKPVDSLMTDSTVLRILSYLSLGLFVWLLGDALVSGEEGALYTSFVCLFFALVFRIKPRGLYSCLKKHGVEFLDENYLGIEYMVLVKDKNSALGVVYDPDEGDTMFLIEPTYANIETNGDFFIVTDISGRCGAFNHQKRKMVADCKYASLKVNDCGDIEAYMKDEMTIIMRDGTVKSYLRVPDAHKDAHLGIVYIVTDKYEVEYQLKKVFDSTAGTYDQRYVPVCINDVYDVDDSALAETAKSLNANIFTQIVTPNRNVPTFVFAEVVEADLLMTALEMSALQSSQSTGAHIPCM